MAKTSEEAMEAIERPSSSLAEFRRRARARVVEQHSAEARARELEAYLDIPSKGATRRMTIWGVVPAAGAGSRMKPLAFSKELLPVGSRREGDLERPKAVSEYLLDRMVLAERGKFAW